MKYNNVVSGTFLSRPNRFIAIVQINGQEEIVHVKNTGRCRELLQHGRTVYLSVAKNPSRKTKFDLIAVEKPTAHGMRLINMDSQIPNDVAKEWILKGSLFSKEAKIKREVSYGRSRFDLYIEDQGRKAFIEVKGVTLEQDGVALFPDAPTERGIKHLLELITCKKEGYDAYILFIIQMKEVSLFRPNERMHPAFATALREAEKAGVKILAIDCEVSNDSITPSSLIPYEL